MLRNLKEFYYPTTVPEALAILERFNARAAVVAGGTTMGRLDDAKIEAAVDITRMGLSFIKEDKHSLRIGATTTFEEMSRSRKLLGFAGGIVAKAASAQPSRSMRNSMTAGGAIVMASPWAELPPALLALDAQVLITGKADRVVPFEEFVKEARYRQLGRTEILTEIRLPRAMSHWRSGYEVFARTTSDPAWAIAACLLEEADGKCSGARVVLGGITRRATRSAAAEKKLAGKALKASHFAAAAKESVTRLEAISDWRAGREHRVQVAEVLVRRTLQSCWEGVKP